ncbi:MAG: SgcJ/EcaC family oxidoreductase [Alphaproteobacteria bacterium]|nr:SgcJ/EcaC family oxidoreductase [Alphaproteobacteria bacterium]
MRRTALAALAALACFSATACTTTAPEAQPLIERTTVMESARMLTLRYADAWSTSDWPGFGALYTADARHVNTTGEFWRGRAQIVDVHRKNRATFPASVRMTARLEGARAISDDAIVAVVRLEIVNDPAKPGAVSATRVTFTLVERDAQWRIAQAHGYPAT